MNKIIILVIFLLIFNIVYAQIPEEVGLSNNKLASTTNSYFFIAPSTGVGFSSDFAFAYGVTFGWGNKKLGRVGLNFTNALANSRNLTIQYERLFLLSHPIYISPKIGAGIIMSAYENEGSYSINRSFSFCFGPILGGALEIDFSENVYIAISNIFFIGLEDISIYGEKNIGSNFAILATFGFRL